MLVGLCELPTVKKMCDKTKHPKMLNEVNYTEDELKLLLSSFEKNKRQIIEYAFLGIVPKEEPELFMCSVYDKDDNVKKNIVIWKTSLIIDEISENEVKIRKSCTVIEIGRCFTFQRKGGDNGKISANQFQFKLIPTLLSTKYALVVSDMT